MWSGPIARLSARWISASAVERGSGGTLGIETLPQAVRGGSGPRGSRSVQCPKDGTLRVKGNASRPVLGYRNAGSGGENNGPAIEKPPQ